MGYADLLRKTFPDLSPGVEDLFLLEAHEVAELPQRAPARELAAVLRATPMVLVSCRRGTLRQRRSSRNCWLPTRRWTTTSWRTARRRSCGRSRTGSCTSAAPELYDRRVAIAWDPGVVTSKVDLRDARVIDAGAGTGRVALSLAPLAREVHAVEPVAALRRYLRAAAADRGLNNVYVQDGFLHKVPLPPDAADVLVTCHSIGWDLPAELREIERLVRTGGVAMHVFDAAMADPGPLGEALLAAGYDYELSRQAAPGSLHCYTRWY